MRDPNVGRSTAKNVVLSLAAASAFSGIVLVILAGYSWWRAFGDGKTQEESAVDLLVENRDYIFDSPVKPGHHMVRFFLHNPSRKPIRVVGTGKVCGMGICPSVISDLPLTLEGGDQGSIEFDCSIAISTGFQVSFPLYYDWNGSLKEIELSISSVAIIEKDLATKPAEN